MLCWRVPVMFWAEHQTCQLVMFPSGCVPFLLRKSWTWHWYVDVISSSEGWITSHFMFSVVLSNYVVMPVDPPLKIRFSTSTVKMYTFSSECDQASFKDWWGPKWSADITFCSIFASQQSNQSAMFFLTRRSKLPPSLKTLKVRQNDSLVVCVLTWSCFSICVKCQKYHTRKLR